MADSAASSSSTSSSGSGSRSTDKPDTISVPYNRQIPSLSPLPWMQPKTRNEKIATGITDSCAFKGVMSGAAGGVLGLVFGFAFGGLDAGPMQQTEQPLKNAIRESFKQSGKRALEMSKSFALLGAIFSFSECCIDKIRAKHDIYNGLLAGCMTGALIARKAGPHAMGLSCVGMAAFSAVIDGVMHLGSGGSS